MTKTFNYLTISDEIKRASQSDMIGAYLNKRNTLRQVLKNIAALADDTQVTEWTRERLEYLQSDWVHSPDSQSTPLRYISMLQEIERLLLEADNARTWVLRPEDCDLSLLPEAFENFHINKNGARND